MLDLNSPDLDRPRQGGARSKGDKKRVQIGVRVRPEVRRALLALADQEGVFLTEVIEPMLLEGLRARGIDIPSEK